MPIELITFLFQNTFIRVLLIGDAIWFIASDVAKALGYANPQDAVKKHCKHTKLLNSLDCANRAVYINQKLNSLDPKIKIIPESDFYRISVKTRKSEAETLIDWVSDTVIPTIRNRHKESLTPAAKDIITYNGIQFLRHQEEYEVRKGKIDTLAFYTQRDTGISGMNLRSVANGCGVALKSLRELLEEKNIDFFLEVRGKQGNFADNHLIIKGKEVTTKPDDFYLIKTSDVYVILDIYCERILRYYAYESRYKKTKALLR
ncbi:hypothetical protein TI05_13095 [Achromatium sp. WMS3]|nr:hypothetical protein TI05_13095 [Achromatium sp. WMS3]